ncbi:MAG TPA: bacillithiol transferase BstA [Terriglobales bacterium]|nr:bacillithiol transferase BstA [Terriglobales bacterium]
MNTDPRFPIGKPELEETLTPAKRLQHIETIADLRAAIKGLTDIQLDTPYREGGWSVRQVVHHLPDSHLNSYVRFKLALTEDQPTIKPYDEAAWASLPDSSNTPVEVSLQLLESLHTRWVQLMKSLTPADFARTFKHPERGAMNLDKNLCLYAWHGPHHIAHIQALRDRMGWQ